MHGTKMCANILMHVDMKLYTKRKCAKTNFKAVGQTPKPKKKKQGAFTVLLISFLDVLLKKLLLFSFKRKIKN